MNIFTATRHLAFVGKLFAAAKLNLDEFLAAGDESALHAHLESLRGTASATVSVTLDGKQVDAAILSAIKGAGIEVKEGATPAEALKAALAAAEAKHTALISALTAKGVKVTAESSPEAVGTALDSRISTAAGELLAKRGLRDFPEQQVETDPTKPGAVKTTRSGVAGLADIFRTEIK